MLDNNIFALDIGTRSVVGVIMQETAKGLEILAAEQLEHPNRAMIDGQIHDIGQVAKAISIVKEKLEAKIGQTLSQAAVAAAGRALRTVRLKVYNDIPDYKEVHRDDILRLELQAVQEAQGRLAEDEPLDDTESLNYHCVGYSVVNYELDGFKIGNLYGQKGKIMGVEVIATFLPRVVVDSLFAALHRAELEMTSLTLEPIAASAVVVPPSMRQLNIALVDIGAGTSDIAVTDDGAIVGFGMVPVAGDEITEVISHHYLLDFNQAETIKRAIHNQDEIVFNDVLGNEQKATKQELLDVISEAVQALTRQITERVMELNGRTPQAVICIGGGSLTPLLKDMLADNMGLSKQRVGIRGREAIAEVFGAQELVGPEAVTPIGIGVTAFEHKGLGFARVMVNEHQVRLFEVNRGTVADALLAAGVSMRRTQPRLGMALTVTVNRELKIIKGGRGKAAVIKLNGRDVTIDTPVRHDDVIEFLEAEDGENATGRVFDVVPHVMPLNVSINEEPFTVNPVITMNGVPVGYHDELVDNARIVYHVPRTLAEILEIAGHRDLEGEYHLLVNERVVDPMAEINDGDDITVEKVNLAQYVHVGQESAGLPVLAPEQAVPLVQERAGLVRIIEPAGDELAEDESAVAVHEADAPEETYIQGELEAPVESAQAAQGVTVVTVNQAQVEIPRANVILTDILTRIDFPLTPPRSKTRLNMTVNGMPAEFTTPLKNGDSVSLDWE